MRVLHLSSLHRGDDSRMVMKMAFATAKQYPTTVIATRVKARHPSIQYKLVPFYASLWKRLLFVHLRVLWISLRARPRLVHVHAPELLPIAYLLHVLGAVVIYDVYENMPRQLAVKQINNGWLYRATFTCFDRLARRLFYFIFAEDSYLESYQNLRKTYAVIHNFPDLSTIPVYTKPADSVHPSFFYLGQISKARCIDVMIQASVLLKKQYPDFRWHIFGQVAFDLTSFHEIEALPGYEEVKDHFIFHGYTPALQAYPVAAESLAGVALIRPIGDFPGSYPTKIFEYMALGLPVITSDFPLYQAVVEQHQCGFCLNPTDVQSLYTHLVYLIEHPSERNQMGLNGKKAVREGYNWAAEEQKLQAFYQKIIVQESIQP
ncbi:MAG: glycosyltransferase [Siphonobacter sp.]